MLSPVLLPLQCIHFRNRCQGGCGLFVDRVIVYIDGFNLYFGMKSQGYRRYYWLDVCKLGGELIKPGQRLAGTKYFTSRVRRPPEKQKRQATYIEALETLPDLSIYLGKYTFADRICAGCGHIDKVPMEKMTDVNIAVELLADAFQNTFDAAIVVSGDSDLTGPVAAVQRLFPNKGMIVAFPPARYTAQLAQTASAFVHIDRNMLAKSQLPPSVTKPGGIRLSCPAHWH